MFASRSKIAFFQAVVSFLEAEIQKTHRLLIDLFFVECYFLLLLMLTGYNSVSRGIIFEADIAIIYNFEPSSVKRLSIKKNMNRESYESQYMVLPESNCW